MAEEAERKRKIAEAEKKVFAGLARTAELYLNDVPGFLKAELARMKAEAEKIRQAELARKKAEEEETRR